VNKNDLGCEYYKTYQRLPLDFSYSEVIEAAEVKMQSVLERERRCSISRLDYTIGCWIEVSMVFVLIYRWYLIGPRINLSLPWKWLNDGRISPNRSQNSCDFRWSSSHAHVVSRLLLFDIPKNLQYLVENSSINYAISFAQLVERENLFGRKPSLEKNGSSSTRFWQVWLICFLFGSDGISPFAF
jgi:hypothetical protein